MISLTPVLFVEKIEPSLDFWVRGLGFEQVMEVPGEGGLAFVMLKQGNIEVMYQNYASLEEDLPKIAKEAKGSPNFLYIKVDDLDEMIKNLEDFEIVTERRQTFYGADEIGYKEPGGHFITFAKFKE
ncbi:MAG: VOC family protein [Proteobacteria bacterium]|nr:VOC family protein [Pseudomonadota bacterium]